MATRRESVVLNLDDHFSAGMIRCAAATSVLDKGLGGLDQRQVAVAKSARQSSDSITRNARSLDDLERNARKAERSTSLLVDSLVVLSPALVPIGALAVPALVGLTAELGAAAGGVGVLLAAFKGVGTALKAVDAYQLDPTAANLAKVNAEMSKLGPSGREFVRELDRMEPALKSLKAAAESGVFTGATDGLQKLITMLPQARRIVTELSGGVGSLLSDAGTNLNSPDARQFFNYLETDAKPLLLDFGHTAGNALAGIANILVALEPSERQFSSWLAGSAKDFRTWTAGLQGSAGLQNFLDYVDQTGPQVAETLGAVGGALGSIVEAAAPVGGPTLKALTAVAHVVETIASSPVGTPLIALASGLTLVNRALNVSARIKDSFVADLLSGKAGTNGARGVSSLERIRAQTRGLGTDLRSMSTEYEKAGRAQSLFISGASGTTGAAQRTRAKAGQVAKGAAIGGGVALVASGTADKIGLANTATLAFAGSLAGPLGAAIGGGIGLLADLRDSAAGATDSIDNLNAAARGNNLAQLSGDLAAARAQMDKIGSGNDPLDYLRTGAKFIGGLLRGDNIANNNGDIDKAQQKFEKLKQTLHGVSEIMATQQQNPSLTLGPLASLGDYQKLADSITPALDSMGLSLSDLANVKSYAAFDKIVSGISAYNTAADSTAGRTKVLGSAIAGLDDPLLTTADSAAALATALDGLIGPGLNAEAAADRMRASLRALRTELKASAGFRDDGGAGTKNRALTRQAATDISARLKAAADNGASGAKLIGILKRSREAFIQDGVAAGFSRHQIAARARALGLTPKLIQTLMKLNGSDKAAAQIRELLRLRAQFQDKSAIFRLIYQTQGKKNQVQNRAGGGLLDGPGTKTSDSIPAMLSRGEYVVRAAAVDKYGPGFFDRANAMQFADGGMASHHAIARAHEQQMALSYAGRQSAPMPTSFRIASGRLALEGGGFATIKDAHLVAEQVVSEHEDMAGMTARAGG